MKKLGLKVIKLFLKLDYEFCVSGDQLWFDDLGGNRIFINIEK